jgi:Flp pilus assembly protein TadD
MKKTIVFTAGILALALAAGAQFQGRIEGRVFDTAGTPIEKAEVSIVSQRTSSVHYELSTDKEGKFIQVGLIPGYFLITVKKSGFQSRSSEFRVGVAGDVKLEVKLETADQITMKSISEGDKLFLKGNKFYAEQKFAEAAAVYAEAVALTPGNWGYHLNLGLALKKMDRRDEALAAFRKAVELNPESYSANKEIGELLAKAGSAAEARAFYEKAAALGPDDPDAHYNLGACLMNAGESEAAFGHFQKAVELKPDYAEAYYQMGTILIGRNQIPEAVKSLEKFLELAPNHPQAPVAQQLLQALKK